MNDQVKNFVRLARQLPKSELDDLILFLKVRLTMNRTYRVKWKPPSAEQWELFSYWQKWSLFYRAVLWSTLVDINRKVSQTKITRF